MKRGWIAIMVFLTSCAFVRPIPSWDLENGLRWGTAVSVYDAMNERPDLERGFSVAILHLSLTLNDKESLSKAIEAINAEHEKIRTPIMTGIKLAANALRLRNLNSIDDAFHRLLPYLRAIHDGASRGFENWKKEHAPPPIEKSPVRTAPV